MTGMLPLPTPRSFRAGSLCSEPESPAPHSESYVARLGPRVAENFLWPIEMPDTTVGSLGHPEAAWKKEIPNDEVENIGSDPYLGGSMSIWTSSCVLW